MEAVTPNFYPFPRAQQQGPSSTITPVTSPQIMGIPAQEVKEKYTFGKTIGKGNFGTVKEGTDNETGTKVAIKIVDKSDLAFDAESLDQEITTLKKVSHPNCVILHEVFDEPKKSYLIMELVSGETVADRIIANSESFTEKDAAAVAENVLSAITYLHSIGITHRDIKPQNMLYASSDPNSLDYNTVKVVDFGLAKYHGNATMKTACGSDQLYSPFELMTHVCPALQHGYESPELLDPNLPYSEGYTPKVDVWSMGVVLYIMLAGYPPFYAQNMAVQMNQIREGKYEFHSPYWDSVSSEAKELVSKMLIVDASQRATAQECWEHPWIKNASTVTAKQLHGSYRAFLLIRRLSIFDNIPPAVLQDITTKLKKVRVQPGEYVMRAGEEGDCMYFINSGTVAVYVDNMEVDRLKTGQFFGEIALTVSKTRTADVMSLGMRGSYNAQVPNSASDAPGSDGVELFQLMRSDLEQLFEPYPILRSRIHKIGNTRRRRASVEHGVDGEIMMRTASMASIAPPTPGCTFNKFPAYSPGSTPSSSARGFAPPGSPSPSPSLSHVVKIDLTDPADAIPDINPPRDLLADIGELSTIQQPKDDLPRSPSPEREGNASDAPFPLTPAKLAPSPAKTPANPPPHSSPSSGRWTFVREGVAPQPPAGVLDPSPPLVLTPGGSLVILQQLQSSSFSSAANQSYSSPPATCQVPIQALQANSFGSSQLCLNPSFSCISTSPTLCSLPVQNPAPAAVVHPVQPLHSQPPPFVVPHAASWGRARSEGSPLRPGQPLIFSQPVSALPWTASTPPLPILGTPRASVMPTWQPQAHVGAPVATVGTPYYVM